MVCPSTNLCHSYLDSRRRQVSSRSQRRSELVTVRSFSLFDIGHGLIKYIGLLGQTFQRCLEEAQGIARSTLFGPIVRKEAVMAMLILSVWGQNGWLPCG